MSPATHPHAPLTPTQEATIRQLLAAPDCRARSSRYRRELLHGLPARSQGTAAALLRWLRAEPEPPEPARDAPTPLFTPDQLEAMKERVRAGYAGRAMEPVGLAQPSLFRGYSGQPNHLNR